MSPAEELRAILASPWVDLQYLQRSLDDLELNKQLDQPDLVTVLVAHAHQPAVWRALTRRAPAMLLETLQPMVAPREDSSVQQGLARALFDRVCLRISPEAIPPGVRVTVNARRRELGAELPAAAWSSPWPSGKKKAAKAAPAPALAAWTERFVLRDAVQSVAEDADRDRTLLERMPAFEGKRSLWALMQMGDQAALALWQTLRPDTVWVWGGELELLIPRMGLAGVEVSLTLVRAFSSGLAGVKDLESPRLSGLMAAHLSGRPALRTIARDWFARFPEGAAVGLVPELLGADRKAKLLALEALRRLQRADPPAVDRALARYSAEVREAVDAAMLEGATMPGRKPALPEFADANALPRPITVEGDASLQKDSLFELLQVLCVTPLDGASWLEPIRARFSGESMQRLTRALFYEWLGAAGPPKDRWALHALAHWPDAAMAKELATLAAELAPRGLSSRAQEMVEVLAAMQTRESLAQVHQLARRSRSKAFRARAELVFVAAAEKMGLSEDELAERLVPDFGLSPEGWLPAKPRVRLTMRKLKAQFVDEAGESVKTLPDAADEEAQAELLELKRRANTLLKEGSERLERRMMHGRSMSLEHFTEIYLMHGLLRRLATGLVWAAVDGERIVQTFTVGEHGAEDVDGQPLQPPAGLKIAVAHPLALDATLRERWMKRALSPPFAQLTRQLRALKSVAELELALRSLEGRVVPVASLLRLDKLGWVRGPEIGRGCYVSCSRELGPLGRVEVEFDPGIYLGDPLGSPDQNVAMIRAELSAAVPLPLLSEIERELREAISPPP